MESNKVVIGLGVGEIDMTSPGGVCVGEIDRYKVFTSSKHQHTLSSPPSLSWTIPTRSNDYHNKPHSSFVPTPGTLVPSHSTKPVKPRHRLVCPSADEIQSGHRRTKSATPLSINQRSNSVPTLANDSFYPVPTPTPSVPGGVRSVDGDSKSTDFRSATRRPSPTYQSKIVTNRRPSAVPKPLDSSNSFGIVVNDKAGKREVRSAYSTQSTSIAINSHLRPEQVNLSFTTKTTIDPSGQATTTWQIHFEPILDSAQPRTSEPTTAVGPTAFSSYNLTALPPHPVNHSSLDPDVASTSPRSNSSAYPPECRTGPTDVVVQVVSATPGSEASVESSREEAALALARGARRMMSKWSDTEGESDPDD